MKRSAFGLALRRVSLRVSAVAIAAAVTACSGGGGSPSTGSSGSNGGGTGPSSTTSAPVTFQMQWASTSTSASSTVRRTPKYLAPTALSVTISVISAPAPWTTATPIIEVLNSPTTTITFTAPTGLDTFLIQTYDEQNGKGNVLSSANVTQTVSGTSANVVSAILNGVIASLALSASGQLTAGTPATISVGATAYDADGNVIVGPGTYASPIQLSINDPSNSGALSLPPPSVIQQPGGTASLAYNGQPLMSANVVGTVAGAANGTLTIKPTPTTLYYTVPTTASEPFAMTVDASSNIWFTEFLGNKIGKFAGGSITETTIPTSESGPEGITVGLDGRIWFAEPYAGKIGSLQPGGSITETAVDFGEEPVRLVDRGDETIWFTGYNGNRIGVINEVSLGFNETALPTADSFPVGIAPASDGYVYFTESSRIGRIHDQTGSIQEITLTQPPGSIFSVLAGPMVAGPDGNLWFVDSGNARIGRVNIPGFTVTFFQTATPNSAPNDITAGPDGALWYTESGVDKIGRMTTSGVATDYALGGSAYPGSLGLRGIAIRSNGQVFFCAAGTNQIGRFFY